MWCGQDIYFFGCKLIFLLLCLLSWAASIVEPMAFLVACHFCWQINMLACLLCLFALWINNSFIAVLTTLLGYCVTNDIAMATTAAAKAQLYINLMFIFTHTHTHTACAINASTELVRGENLQTLRAVKRWDVNVWCLLGGPIKAADIKAAVYATSAF